MDEISKYRDCLDFNFEREEQKDAFIRGLKIGLTGRVESFESIDEWNVHVVFAKEED